jgi:hypothetical protein
MPKKSVPQIDALRVHGTCKRKGKFLFTQFVFANLKKTDKMTHPSHCLAPPPKGEESGTERVIVSDKGMKTIENSVHVVPNSPASSAVKKPVEGPKVTSKSSAETPTPVVKKRRAKKPDDMPRRPLSAYNIFFQNQRRMIVNGESSMPFTLQTPRAPRATRCRKRLHRKMHGKIGFVDLAKTIGRKWKSLNVEEKKPYLKLAGKKWSGGILSFVSAMFFTLNSRLLLVRHRIGKS